MIKGFLKGQYQNNQELQDDFLDWFFLSKFGKGTGYWRKLPMDKIESIIAFQNEHEKSYWDNWVKIYSKIYSK